MKFNSATWSYVVRDRVTQFEYQAWLFAHVGGRHEELNSYVFRPINVAVRMKTSWLFWVRNSVTEEPQGVSLKPGAAWNQTAIRCSSIVQFYKVWAIMSSHAQPCQQEGKHNYLLFQLLHALVSTRANSYCVKAFFYNISLLCNVFNNYNVLLQLARTEEGWKPYLRMWIEILINETSGQRSFFFWIIY